MTFDKDELGIIRRAYAKQILAAAGVENARLEAAFATVPREKFLGPSPWSIIRGNRGYVSSPSDDPVYVYDNVLVRLPSDRGMNNGQPSYHVYLFDKMNPQSGDHIVHIGAGTGYFTAVLAELVGPSGRVTAIEVEPDLARQATETLSKYAHVTVIEGDATAVDFDAADGIYVNAGATHPPDHWLDRLKDDGRLIIPMTRDGGAPGDPSRGVVFMIGRDGDGYSAKFLHHVGIYPCLGARDETAEAALVRALEKGGWEFVQHFHRHNRIAPERCWLWTDTFCFSYD